MPNIEEQIQRAIREGKFSDLPGKGKPLNLDDNPHTDPDWRLAYHILHESGFTLPWLALRREIEVELEAVLETIERAWKWRESALLQGSRTDLVEAEWGRAVQAFQGQIQSLNRRIFDYNLQAPAPRFHLCQLNPQKELERIRRGNRDQAA